jgi:predicted PurR-regulated permease PerM
MAFSVLTIISFWRIYEARNYPGWLSLLFLLAFIPIIGSIPHMIVLGLVAWKDMPGKGGAKPVGKKVKVKRKK